MLKFYEAEESNEETDLNACDSNDEEETVRDEWTVEEIMQFYENDESEFLMKDVDEEIIDMVTKTNDRNTAPQTVDFPLPMSTKKKFRRKSQKVNV